MITKHDARILICLLLWSAVTSAQTPARPQDQGDVVRVFTELVQTDVMVFDKNGTFVNGLKREDFELRIDGKPKSIQFLELVTAGSVNEESQLAAARGSNGAGTPPGAVPLDRGRVVFFYVDDVHMDPASLNQSKKVIKHFIDDELGQNDEVAITSATGQIGFLQQLTDNRLVLRTALERLKYRPYSAVDMSSPRMTEYQALLIDRYDREITEYFIEETLRRNPGMTRVSAENLVLSRSRAILQQAAVATTNTLTGLEGLVRALRNQPGRKLIFFLSGGFFIDHQNTDTLNRLRRITSAAAKSGVVIYSMDARGLLAMGDVSQESQVDLAGRLQRAASGELFASQDAMNALAKDTGGKVIFNSNSLDLGLERALKETATYYLLAWKPEAEAEANKFRKIDVRIAGRPELSVQVRRGYFDIEPQPPAARSKKKEEAGKTPVSELRKVIAEPYPNRNLPVSLNLNYLDSPDKGSMLAASMEVPGELLTFSSSDGKNIAVLQVAGSFYDDRGQVGAFFNNEIKIEAPTEMKASEKRNVVYNYSVFLKPGLYQVRVGARDDQSGRSGSAHAWIEIPDLSPGQFALSSLLLGVRDGSPIGTASTGVQAVKMSVAHHFSPNGYLRFLLFAYNPALSPTDRKPDLAVQVQIIRDGQPVITAPLKKIQTEGLEDLKRIPYAAEVTLAGLQPGRYQLMVSVVDRVAKRSATQQTRFDIK